MKEIRLLTLTLKNFKGIKNFTLNANGENVRVYGDNATGKTTLFDAFIWLLFDKDSNNRKDFAIKTLDKNGNVLHNLDHEVEGVFLVDGKQLTLKKVFSEKWTKRRGSVQAEFTGHTTDYFVDGVPVKKKEYDELISNLIDEDVFKLLTSPTYFNEQLKWQDRRKILLEVCGDITDEEVIASNKDLAELLDILNGRSIENLRKVIAARKKEINDQLEKIPVRIDEIHLNMPKIDGLNKAALEDEISQLNSEIDEKMTLISNIRNGNAISAKQKEIQEIEIELLQIKQQHEAGSKDELYKLKARIQEEQSNLSILQQKAENLKYQKKYIDENIQSFEKRLEELRQEWHQINSEEFKHEVDCTCPTCGQDLPEEQIEAAREKALAQFNLSKARRLEDIQLKGKQGKEQKEQFIAENEKLTKEYEKLSNQIKEKQDLLSKLNNQLQIVESTIVDVTENPQYVAKLQEKQRLEKEIEELRQSANESIQSIQLEIADLKAKRDQLQADLGKFALVSQSEKRIRELEEQERELAAEFENLEHQLYLTEEFIRTKINLLEEKINSKFKYARFKLFEQQINGGLQEVCETLYEGVPYGSGLNNAAKINVGLDIINTLSEFYGFKAPIFVDNAEAVTKLIDVDSQVISLIVSEKDKQLRVELPEKQMKEVI
ncbi:nucleoside triphosphate hydrolase [Aeribacillus phage AP45]|uniref:Nucleoside triphosphate hydrolase n=1 Tax=Aeribacillus phage AP45 TaxID=1913112 RepID=A0A1L2K2K3_9CAUD|nr:SbcC-like subunit of palindrome specific endonuclease [Aeribacillus phage AP45]APC46462.1 nucleoside triphosphate hydrolase [Aeribacillus phage AP45]